MPAVSRRRGTAHRCLETNSFRRTLSIARRSFCMVCYIITFTVSGNFMSSHVSSRYLTVGRRLLIASGLTRMLMALTLLALLWAAIIWSTMLP